MENQDKNTNTPHPKPSDDAQAFVETIIPSTETEESKTTEVKPVKSKQASNGAEDKQEETTSKEEDEVTDKKEDESTDEEDTAEKTDESNEGDQIETVAP